MFVNRLLNILQKAASRMPVTDDMTMNLNWFIQFLSQFNGKVMLLARRSRVNMFVDACLTGMGAIWENNIYAISHHFELLVA